MPRVHTIAALAVALTTAASAAYASTGNENDAVAMTHAKISLSQAVQTAEQHAHGRASSAEYENTSQDSAYGVEVDAQDGSVLASTPDHADHDDDGDETD